MSEVMPFVSMSLEQAQAAEAFRGLAPKPYQEVLADFEQPNTVEQVPFSTPELTDAKQAGMLSKIGALATRGAEWVVDAATAVKVRTDIAIANFMENSKQIIPRAALAGLAIAGAAGLFVKDAKSAEARSQTCISEVDGMLCTEVYGSGTHVDSIMTDRYKFGITPPFAKPICNYSAWFFYSPPEGGAYGLGYQSRQGCNYYGQAWFNQRVNRDFEPGTQVCAKFYENFNQDLVGQKCVGISS